MLDIHQHVAVRFKKSDMRIVCKQVHIVYVHVYIVGTYSASFKYKFKATVEEIGIIQ